MTDDTERKKKLLQYVRLLALELTDDADPVTEEKKSALLNELKLTHEEAIDEAARIVLELP